MKNHRDYLPRPQHNRYFTSTAKMATDEIIFLNKILKIFLLFFIIKRDMISPKVCFKHFFD